MATQVEDCEPFPLTENGENSSLNGCQIEVPEQPSEDEVPVSNDNAEDVKDSPVIDEFAMTVEDGPVSDSATTGVQEGPASDNAATMGMFVSEEAPGHNVAPIVDEAPVSYLDKALVVHEDLPASGEGAADMSIVKVDEGSVSNSAADDGTLSNNIVRVPPEKRTLYKFGQRTSNFRGVTRHRWTGKYEAHLWDNSTITEGRKRKGKQVYLGGYESEQKAAQAYDLAALKYWGASANTKLNFPISTYEKELDEMKDMSREEYVNSLRRKSICFTRGHSIYRGVTRQNEGRRWQARIGRVAGGKDIYLGTYDTEEEAAEAYDIAAVKLRGMNAITNFDISNYYKEGTKELDVIPIKSIEEESSHLKIRYFRLE